MRQSSKLIETCVLYIDIRRSTELNLTHRKATVAKLYSVFARSMTRAARFYGGHVRGIIGDRVMVVFDKENCFKNAVYTSILMNSIANYVINRHFKKNEVQCGIGIDYGRMLVSKVGIIRRGEELHSYRGLVWLGRPANVASKLTDRANKKAETKREDCVEVGFYLPFTGVWQWETVSQKQFILSLEGRQIDNTLSHKDKYFRVHFASERDVVYDASVPCNTYDTGSLFWL